MVEGLLLVIFVSEGIIAFFICQLIDKVSEVNFNLECACKNKTSNNFLDNLELRKVISEYENTIKQLKKENQKLKSYKKGNKTLQKNNQKLVEELNCLRKQYDDLCKNLSIKNSDDDEYVQLGSVIYE